jgi:hypothetical protein
MHIYIYICILIYIGCDDCIYIYRMRFIYICMYMYIYIHTHTHAHSHTHTHTQALEDTGDVGAYNRANRSVHHMVENFGAVVAGLGLVGGQLPARNPKP